MISFELLQLIVNASSQAFYVSEIMGYSQEVVDGGTRNRIWSFLPMYSLADVAVLPLLTMFPTISLELTFLGAAVVVGGILYVASVAETNQILMNQDQADEIITLPWDLHNNTYLTRLALFLSDHLAYPLFVFYMASLVACIFFGAPLYAFISLGMYAVSQVYQAGYIPEVLEMPYWYLNRAMLLFAVCGVTSVLGLVLSLVLIALVVMDYIQCYVWGEASPTVMFPMTDMSKHMEIPQVHAQDVVSKQQFESLVNKHQTHRDNAGLHVTFDHFYASHQLTDKLLEGVPNVDYQRYITLFDEVIDRNDQTFQDHVMNEMCEHDKFNRETQAWHCKALGLPENTTPFQLRVAYLKQEMRYFVERFQQSSYRDFTPQQVITMHRYARLFLSTIEDASLEEQGSYLLHIAVTTGSHCNRAYLENLSDLALKKDLLFDTALSLEEQAVLKVQEVREDAFRTYYHALAPVLKKKFINFRFMWADTKDYCTYEDFVYWFGLNFYLLNLSFTMGFREISEVLWDRCLPFIFREPGRLFSDHYTVDYLVKQANAPEKKLYKIFVAWCNEHQINVLDEDRRFIFEKDPYSPKLRTLIELMLLDFNMISAKTPYLEVEEKVEPVNDTVMPLSSSWSFLNLSIFSLSNNNKPISHDMNYDQAAELN